MSTTCPHCGVTITDDQPMCGACQALFQSHDAPPPPVKSAPPPPSPPINLKSDNEPISVLQRKAQPLSGWTLLGIGVGMYLFCGLVRATAGNLLGLIPSAIMLVLVCSSWIVAILGIVRLFTDGKK